MKNAIFVAKKPSGIVCNHFLSKLKRKFGVKKAGFSGTLDPFASGVLIVAFGNYTRLFRVLKKSPKIYIATVWLGANCDSLDNENIDKIEVLSEFKKEKLDKICKNLTGEIEFIPPKFSAKKINGIRAYKLARNSENFELRKIKMQVFDAKILNYSHPFLSIEISLSEGGYVRSWAEIFAKKLGICATLCYLERLKEGNFVFENEKFLNPIEFLDLKENFYNGDFSDIYLGKKLQISNFVEKSDGIYILKNQNLITILKFQNGEIKYELNNFKIEEIL